MRKDPSNKFANAASRTAGVDSALQLGIAAINQRRPADAERIAQTILVQQPTHNGALHILGMALLSQNRPLDALKSLEQPAQRSRDPVIETLYALALRDVGQKSEAIACLQRATTRIPAFPRAFNELGILLGSLSRYDEAEAALKRGLTLAPSVVELSIELGGVYIARADSEKAKTAFAHALANSPGHARALHGFGTALLFEGDFGRAAERFRQVLARDPTHARAHLDLAHCMLELGQFQAAVDVLRSLVRTMPQQYGKALRILVSSGRGRFWLRPSAAAAMLKPDSVTQPIPTNRT
jgi:tetratricopeptide (TPR) repeat protein